MQGSSAAERQTHNLEAGGSTPSPAPTSAQGGPFLAPVRGDIIIPRYRGESRSFQRASDWLFGSEEGFNRYIAEKRRKAEKELAEIAEQEKSESRRAMNGLGQVKLNVSVTDWTYWNILYPGCWQDKTFVGEYHRDNPQARANRPQQKTFSVGAVTA